MTWFAIYILGVIVLLICIGYKEKKVGKKHLMDKKKSFETSKVKVEL